MPDLVGVMGPYARARYTRAYRSTDRVVASPFEDQHPGDACARTVFVELKSLSSWQGDLGLSPEQRLWQARWAGAGGAVFTLAKVEGIVYLVRGDHLLRSGTREEWKRVSSYVGQDWKEVETCLISTS